jgi:hypothetical protein
MNKISIAALAMVLSVLASAEVCAETQAKADHQSARTRAEAAAESEHLACRTQSGNARDICQLQAQGKLRVALAEAEQAYKPSLKSQYRVQLAKSDSTYKVAKERCDDLAGNARDICIKEAKSVDVASRADARVQLKTAEANVKASDKTTAALAKAETQKADARHDADADKKNALYKVEKEKCDAYAGGAKDHCLEVARAKQGKS